MVREEEEGEEGEIDLGEFQSWAHYAHLPSEFPRTCDCTASDYARARGLRTHEIFYLCSFRSLGLHE